jgi:PmbA protein
VDKGAGERDLLEIAERVAGWAGAGEEVEAYVVRGRETDVDVYDGDVEAFSAADSEGVGIRVIASGRQGFAHAGSLDPDVIAEAFADARENAAFGTEDEFAGLAQADGVPALAMSLYNDELAAVSAEDKIALALDLERRVKEGDSRIRAVPRASYGDSALEVALATSTGISAAWARTRCGISAYALAGDGNETQTGGGYSVGQGWNDLDLDKAATDAVDRATRMLGATKPASARLPVVFQDTVTAAVLSVIGGTLSGDAVLKGRSPFADRMDETVASPLLTLVDDPTDRRAYGAGRFDAEGLASRRNTLIADGVLRGFLYDSHAARRAGCASTASAVRGGFKGVPGVGCRALTANPGASSTDEILRAVGTGLYVQSVSGLHSGVNAVSGDFSVGAEGLMIRDGQLAEPVREVTVASTIQRILQEVIAVGDTLEWLPGAAAGVTLAIEAMSISGA